MAKVKVVNNNLDQNLNGNYFNNTASQTVFSFGRFEVTSNFDGRIPIDYTNTLSSFVRPVTLETMGVTDVQSEIIFQYDTNAVLNLDKSDLNTFIRFGSAYEFLRISIERIITEYPGSIFMNSQISRNNNITYFNYIYDSLSNTSTFNIPINCIINTFGLVYNYGNTSEPDNKKLKNINLSYEDYIVWTSQAPDDNTCNVIGFTGNTSGRNYLMVKVNGNPFSMISSNSAPVDFHIKPNNFIFEEFRTLLNQYERYIVSSRDGLKGFRFVLKDPTLLEDGNITYSDTTLLWSTVDGYNLDINTPSYQKFLESLLTIGAKYDKIKTDLIARFLTPASLKAYDLTEEGKMTKLLRIYGREFDQLRQFIDSLVYINKVTYDKINNIPDQLVKNLSRTFGWNYFSLVNENELVDTFLTIDENERNLNEDLLPAEIDIELWRRILMNTNYFWKSKGTRESIKAMFLLIGIPEPFINITEYVYTVDGKINPNEVTLGQQDFPSNSLPYDTSGYPVAPLETPDFFFQVSGDTDSGQAYMNVFRMAGFQLTPVVDNKKSWIQTGSTVRIDDTTPQYYQADSKLVLNTKEVDVTLDTARGIEYDVYKYIQTDFAANSSGYTLPFSYVNISLPYAGTQNSFQLPFQYAADGVRGKLEVRYNGILLTPSSFYDGTTVFDMPPPPYSSEYDYTYNSSTNTIYLNGEYAINSGNRRDVIQATFVYSGGTSPVSGISVQYVVARIKPDLIGTYIPLPSYPRGDVQITINGIALTKASGQFTGDYVLDPNNSTGGTNNIIITNPEIIAYFSALPQERNVVVTYVEVNGSNSINARSEVLRVDSFNSSKLYYNYLANKYVYKLNYKVNNAENIKVLIDGIALEPEKDYTLNWQNAYEIFLPNGIQYGTVISVYYLVGGDEIFFPIVPNNFGVGDISALSFLEFIELIQRRLINARNRKIISDFKGGWYPALLKVYTEYLKRANLPDDNPLKSNGYTFNNLYSFLSKYNSFFQRFVDQLLPATIILKKSGLLIRNTVFTKQKFAYKRGVNLFSGGTTSTIDMRGMPMLPYYGDDGCTFLIAQDVALPSAQLPVVITNAITNITQTTAIGGGNVTSDGGATVLYRGVVWSANPNPTTANYKTTDGGGLGSYTSSMGSLYPNATYYVRAYATNVVGTAYGDELQFTTAQVVVVPKVDTKDATSITTTSFTSGGINIVGVVEYYSVQVSTDNFATYTDYPTPPASGPLAVGVDYTPLINITGLVPSTTYKYRAYILVAGTPYYGAELTMTTLALPATPPLVGTGEAANITDSSIAVFDNVVSSKGVPTTIPEYGVLFTQAPLYGSAPMLTLANQAANPTTIFKTSNAGIATVPYTWDELSISGLQDNTTVYFRAYARNGVGESTVGYGDVQTAQTLLVKRIDLYQYAAPSGTDGGNYRWECYCLISTPPMVAGECACVCLGLPLYVSPQLIGTGYPNSCSSYCVYCNNVLYWGALPSFCDLYSTSCSPDSISCKEFIFREGDTVKILQKALTYPIPDNLGKGGTNSCACIRGVSSISGSGSFAVGTTCRSSCAYSG